MKNRREVTLEEMRTIQLDILDKIHDYCEKNNLRYSLCGGTLLGAVRHQGYIPWDDDIDIMMPRPDYEKFFADFNGAYSDINAQYYRNSKTIFFTFGKVYNNKTLLIEKDLCRTGVFVDVFPIDGMPDTIEETLAFRDLTTSFVESLKKTSQYYKIKKGRLLRLKYYLKILRYPARSKTIQWYDNLLKELKFNEKEYAGVIYGIYGLKERLKCDVFKSYIELPFEGKKRKCIKQYDEYLSSLYGNYMELPPVEKRQRHHLNEVYWL